MKHVKGPVPHTVEAINLQEDLLMVKMGTTMGLARIERYLAPDMKHEQPKDIAAYAEYMIGKDTFTIPLKENLGMPVFIGPTGLGERLA